MTANLSLLQQRATEIRRRLAQLAVVARVDPARFAADDDLVDAALYRLQVAIEAAQAICSHIAARVPTRVPDSAPDCFRSLAEAGILETELGERLCSMARFRNLLVHRYWELDLNKVHAILGNDIHDLETYLDQVAAYLEQFVRHSPDSLPDLQRALVNRLEARPEVVFSYLHGSAAEGLAFRDLDVGVYLDPLADPFDDVLRLTDWLEKSVRVPCDVHVLNDSPLGFCYQVSRGRVLSCRDEERLAQWREDTWNRYFDYEPWLRQHTRDLLRL